MSELPEVDRQYNPSLGVKDPAAEMARYVAGSMRARELPCVLDVPFGPTKAETLDIFPADKPGAPVFVFIHGGYWRAFTSKEFSLVALGLRPLGVTTVVINYALAPGVTLDEITRQARAAVAWVLKNIDRHGGDPARVAIGGHSAGGHLSAMCLLAKWAEDYGLAPDPLRAAVLVSGLYDLAPLRASYLQPQIQLDDGIIRRNSPAYLVRKSATPIWTTWGGGETTEFARQSKLFHDAWTGAGNVSRLEPIPGANHFSAIHSFEQPDGVLARWVADALR